MRRKLESVGLAIALLLGCSTLSPTPAAAAGGTSLVVSPSTSSVNPGQSFQVDIVINTDAPTRGLQLGMTYDPHLVQVDQVLPGSFYQAWSDAHGGQGAAVLPFQPENGNGRLNVGAIVLLGGPVDGPTGSGTVLSVRMTARGDVQGRTSLLLTDVIVSNPQAESIPNVTWTGGVVGVGLAPEAIGPPPGSVLASTDTPTLRTRPASDQGLLAAVMALPPFNFFAAGLLAGCAGTLTCLFLLGHLRLRPARRARVVQESSDYALER
jgi:hypothetical protein